MAPQPPRRMLRFLRWFCREDFLEEIEGDLVELFERRYLASQNKAKWEFCRNVLLHFRWDFIRSFKLTPIFFTYDMLKNYLKIAYRNIIRYPSFSSLNILGLTLGMTAFALVFLWIQDEQKVDAFHENSPQLYNIYQTGKALGTEFGDYSAFHRRMEDGVDIPIGGVKEALPEVERLSLYATGYELPWGHPETFQVGDRIHKLTGSRANEDFLNMFSFPIIAGDKVTPLSDVNSIVVSRDMAALFFSSPQEAIGKTIRYEDRLDFTITAVLENVPSQSTLQFEFLLNWDSHLNRLDWASHNILSTLQLQESANIEEVEVAINRFFQSHFSQDNGIELRLGLQPFGDRYLVSNFVNGKPSGGRIEYLHIFGGVGIFILLLACINFMNLSTARATKRSKEVGIRKVIGSLRIYLIGQFLGESLLLAMLSLGLTLCFLSLLLPYFNAFTGKSILLPYTDTEFWTYILLATLGTGLVAGSYPALYLSSLKPIRVLSGTLRISPSSIWFRKGLTIFQFSLSTLLLIATIVVSQQTLFIQDAHLGYDRENLLYVRVEGELVEQENYRLFKEKASLIPGVAMVDRSSETPHIMNFLMSEPFEWEGKEETASVGFKPSSVGFDFVELMKLEIVEGRGFSREYSTDSAEAFLVNEEAVRQMGMQEPIGKWISAWNKKGRIIGILKDYHTHSFHEPIKPLIIDVKEYERFGVILIRTLPGNIEETLAKIEESYLSINPHYPFDYQFVDQEFQRLYESETQVAQLSNIFALLAIIISCVGLFGSAMFTAQQRVKEISIRKILGASFGQIVASFSREFLVLIGVAFLIAVPISWLLMYSWLQGFAYRIDLAWWIFALAGIVALVIAFLSICSQSVKVATLNPVDGLKEE